MEEMKCVKIPNIARVKFFRSGFQNKMSPQCAVATTQCGSIASSSFEEKKEELSPLAITTTHWSHAKILLITTHFLALWLL